MWDNDDGQGIFNTLLKNSNNPFEAKLISKYLIQLKYSNNNRVKDELKWKIFISTSKLFVKAINNFFYLVQTIPFEKIIHTNEDIASECYIVMSNCIDNLQIHHIKKFYFYLNTSLNRHIFRLYEKNYKKHFDVVNNIDSNVLRAENKGYLHHFDMSSIDLVDFNELEINIIKFKMSGGGKLSVFLKKEKLSSIDFFEKLELIKIKLIERYK